MRRMRERTERTPVDHLEQPHFVVASCCRVAHERQQQIRHPRVGADYLALHVLPLGRRPPGQHRGLERIWAGEEGTTLDARNAGILILLCHAGGIDLFAIILESQMVEWKAEVRPPGCR